MSLIKYTAFINSLLSTVQNSGVCCKIYRTPSAPVGYADDLAACCVQQNDLKRVMQIVHDHGRTWRFDFNAKKSGILVFGESKREHGVNRNERNFMLGNEKVNERENWSIVIPIATFGAELWPFNDKCLSLLESFQTFVGKRIQRFGPKSPNLCTYFA